MDIEFLKQNNLIIYECISGSRAYGLDTATSDTDIKGIFILPEDRYYGFDYIDQINNESNDIVYYELKKFFYLLSKNNPTILEMISSPEDCILIKNEILNNINSDIFLSKLCKKTFANYALTQVKRARGLNKKIVNPIGKDRKTILDFCYVTDGHGTIELHKWLDHKSYKQSDCGLAKLSHIKDLYALFYKNSDNNADIFFHGIIKNENSDDVCVSSIPKDMKHETYLYFNRDEYMIYCKKYKEYWDWVKNRNEDRYRNNISHGKNYDSKNMMHTFRLLEMAKEIAQDKKIIVRRPDREFLLKIKKGEFEYDTLIKMAEDKINEIEQLFEKSDLPESPDSERINSLLVEMRKKFYLNQ